MAAGSQAVLCCSTREGEVMRISPHSQAERSALHTSHSWKGFLHLTAAWFAQGSQGPAFLGLLQVMECPCPELPVSAEGQGLSPGQRASAPARVRLLLQLCSAFKLLPAAQSELPLTERPEMRGGMWMTLRSVGFMGFDLC